MNAPCFLTPAVAFAVLTLLTCTATDAAQSDSNPVDTTGPAVTAPVNPSQSVQLSSGAEDVLKLTRAKVSEAVIVAFIQASDHRYNISASEIVSLREAGVTDRVLTTMLNQNQQPVTVPSQNQAAIAAAPAATPSTESFSNPTTETPQTSVILEAGPSYVSGSSAYYFPDSYYYPYSWSYRPYWYSSYWYPSYGYSGYCYPYSWCSWYPWAPFSFGFAYYWGDCDDDFNGSKFHAGNGQGQENPTGNNGSQQPALRGSSSGGSTAARPSPNPANPMTAAGNGGGQSPASRAASGSTASASSRPSLKQGNTASTTSRPSASSTSRPTPTSTWGNNANQSAASRVGANSVAAATSRPSLNRANPTTTANNGANVGAVARPGAGSATRPTTPGAWGNSAGRSTTSRASSTPVAAAPSVRPTLNRATPTTAWNNSAVPRANASPTTAPARPSPNRPSPTTTWNNVGSRSSNYRPSTVQAGSYPSFSSRSSGAASGFQSSPSRSAGFSRSSPSSAPAFRGSGSSASFRGGGGGSVSRPSGASFGGGGRSGGGGGRSGGGGGARSR